MTPRRTKRYINKSSDYVVFTAEENGDKLNFRVMASRDEAWEILLNLAITDYHIRETFRNIITTADEHIKNNKD